MFQDPPRIKEPVGGDQVDPRVSGPVLQQSLHDTRGRALAHGDAAREADEVRHSHRLRIEEGRHRSVECLTGRDLEIDQPRQRQVDVHDFVERDAVVEPAQRHQVVLG